MAKRSKPKFYNEVLKRHPDVFKALEKLGKATRAAGPIDVRTAHLVHLAAAAAIRSEGAVHSHTRRAIEAGVSAKEIRHALIMLLSTIGMPSVVAAMSWAEDVLEEKQARSASR